MPETGSASVCLRSETSRIPRLYAKTKGVDGFALSHLVEELAETILGARVEKIQLGDPWTLLLKLYRPSQRPSNLWLLLSVEPRWPRVYLVERPVREEVEPTPFLLLARKYLRGARVGEIAQVRRDRIVRFLFRGSARVSEAGDEGEEENELMPEEGEDAPTLDVVLVAELFGRTPNLFLLDASGCIRERFLASDDERCAPGALYLPPAAPEKRDPLALSREEFQQLLARGPSLAESIVGTIEGFSPLYAAEVEARWRDMSGSAEPSPDLAYAAFRSVVEDLIRRPAEPILYTREPLERMNPVQASPRDVRLSAIPLTHLRDWTATRVESFSRAAALYYDLVRRIERAHAMRTTLLRHLATQIEKRERLRERLEADERALGDPERWRRWGELLLANAQTAVRTASGFLVTDYFDPEQPILEIPAAAPTPQQAAESYFQRYRKAKQGTRMIAARREVIERELEELRRARERAVVADEMVVLEEIARDLGLSSSSPASGTNRPPAVKTEKRTRASWPGVYRFRSSDGFEILVGKSAADNERLTFRVAAPHDLWLHAADYPGSHVIIRRAKRQAVPPRTLREAAQLAAFFSQARHSSKVVVNYTERKFVSKIPCSKPGLVRVSEMRSLVVEPKIEVERVLEET
ncbi:MAG: NFACT family protein [Blastocatellia bacterium]|nr:NFACT family protein [Blastocatellia bacterium]